MELNNFQYLGSVSIFSDTGKCFRSINNRERYPMSQGSWFVSKRKLLAMFLNHATRAGRAGLHSLEPEGQPDSDQSVEPACHQLLTLIGDRCLLVQ